MYANYVDAMKGKKRMNLSSSVVEMENNIVDDDSPAVEADDSDSVTIPTFEPTRPAWRYARNTINKRGQWLKLHQENRLDELAYDVAQCHVMGVFTELAKLTGFKPDDGWYKVESGCYHTDTIQEVGRVFVVNDMVKDVLLSQTLDSGFYGRLLVEQSNDDKSLLRQVTVTESVTDKSTQLSLQLEGGDAKA